MRAIITLLALALAACADTVTTNLSAGLNDRSVVVTFLPLMPAMPDGSAQAVCHAWGFERGTQACVKIARDPIEAKKITDEWVRRGGLISCLVVTPPNEALLLHEMTLCATNAVGYWHKQ